MEQYTYNPVPVTTSFLSPNTVAPPAPGYTTPLWKTKQRSEACSKCRVFVPISLLTVAAVVLALWIADELPGVGSPLDPEGGVTPPPVPINPAYYNHTLGPLEPSIPSEYIINTDPVAYALSSATGLFVWTIHSNTRAIMSWSFDHLFYTQTLLNAQAASVVPFANPVYAYATHTAQYVIVAFAGSSTLVMYQIDGMTANLQLSSTCYTRNIGQTISMADDPSSTTVVGTDSLYFYYMTIINGTLNSSYPSAGGNNNNVVLLSSVGLPPALVVGVESRGLWAYSVHAHLIVAWSLYNISVYHTVVTNGNSFAPQLEIIDVDTLCVLDLGTQQLIFYTVNATNGSLVYDRYLEVAPHAYAFAIMYEFAYALSPLLIQQWNWHYDLPLNPPSLPNPFSSNNNSLAFMLAFPSDDAVSVYSKGGTTMYQFVVE